MGEGTGQGVTARRELRLALLLVLAGAALVLLAARQHWVDVVLPQASPLPPRSEVRSGAQVVPALAPLGLLGLAGVAALAATRSYGRVLVGVLLLLAGVAAAVATAAALGRGALPAVDQGGRAALDRAPGFTGWPWVALAGGVLLAGGGVVVAARGRRWAGLSTRYEAPAARAQRPPARPEVAAWDALDRGEDPTAPVPAPGPGTATPVDGAGGGPPARAPGA